MRVLGIAARTHDSGIALLQDGIPQLVLEEERFRREKRTKKFPAKGLEAAFDELGLGIADVDVITIHGTSPNFAEPWSASSPAASH